MTALRWPGSIARALLADPVPPVALHGDLRHDNVPCGPAREPAKAFRSPDGFGEPLLDPARIDRLTECFLQGLGPPPRRRLGWAAAQCVFSTRWSREDGLDITGYLRLLPLLSRPAPHNSAGLSFRSHLPKYPRRRQTPEPFRVLHTKRRDKESSRGTRSTQ